MGFERSQPEKKPFLAEEAFAAGDREGNHDAVADLELVVFRTDLDDFAHGLVAENVALFHRGHDAVEQMQVRTADGAGGDLDDGVASVLDLGIRHGVASNVVLAVPGQRFHPKSPSRVRSVETNFGGKIGSYGIWNDNGKRGLGLERWQQQEIDYVRFPTFCDRHRCFHRHRI